MSEVNRVRYAIGGICLFFTLVGAVCWLSRCPPWMQVYSRAVPWLPPFTGQPGVHLDLSVHPATLEAVSDTRLQVAVLWFEPFPGEPTPSKLCIDSLGAVEPTGAVQLSDTDDPSPTFLFISVQSEQLPVCYELWQQEYRGRPMPPFYPRYPEGVVDLPDFSIPTGYDVDVPHSLCPYDTLSMEFDVHIQYRLVYEGREGQLTESTAQTAHAIRSVGVPSASGYEVRVVKVVSAEDVWSSKRLDEAEKDHQVRPDKLVTLRLARPLIEQLVFPCIIFTMLAFLFLLSLVCGVQEFTEGGVAFFLGVYGLRAVLLPPNTGIRTLLDFVIWGLYFGFAGLVLSHLIDFWRDLRSNARGRLEKPARPRLRESQMGEPRGESAVSSEPESSEMKPDQPKSGSLRSGSTAEEPANEPDANQKANVI